MKTFRKSFFLLAVLLIITVMLAGCFNYNGIKATGGGKLDITEINYEPADGKAVVSFNADVTEMPDENITEEFQELTAKGTLNFRDLESGLRFTAFVNNIYYWDMDLEDVNGIAFAAVSAPNQNSTGVELFIGVYVEEDIADGTYYISLGIHEGVIDPLNPPDEADYQCSGVLKGRVRIETY